MEEEEQVSKHMDSTSGNSINRPFASSMEIAKAKLPEKTVGHKVLHWYVESMV